MAKAKCPPCEEGAPLWLQTYGDMVTLMLCLFVMIYAAGKSTPQEMQVILSAFKSSLGFFEGGQTLSKGKLEEMGMTMESLPSMTAGRSLSQAKKQAQEIFKPEIRAKKVRVTEDERGLVISLVGVDYFSPGSALLKPEIEETLRKAGQLFRSLDRFVRIEGYAARGEDAVLAGSAGIRRTERIYMNSWDLAGARSVNCAVFLQNQGVPPSFMQAVSYGSYRPLALEGDVGTPEADAHNRRVDLVVLPYKSSKRSGEESGFRLPSTRLPGFESQRSD